MSLMSPAIGQGGPFGIGIGIGIGAGMMRVGGASGASPSALSVELGSKEDVVEVVSLERIDEAPRVAILDEDTTMDGVAVEVHVEEVKVPDPPTHEIEDAMEIDKDVFPSSPLSRLTPLEDDDIASSPPAEPDLSKLQNLEPITESPASPSPVSSSDSASTIAIEETQIHEEHQDSAESPPQTPEETHLKSSSPQPETDLAVPSIDTIFSDELVEAPTTARDESPLYSPSNGLYPVSPSVSTPTLPSLSSAVTMVASSDPPAEDNTEDGPGSEKAEPSEGEPVSPAQVEPPPQPVVENPKVRRSLADYKRMKQKQKEQEVGAVKSVETEARDESPQVLRAPEEEKKAEDDAARKDVEMDVEKREEVTHAIDTAHAQMMTDKADDMQLESPILEKSDAVEEPMTGHDDSKAVSNAEFAMDTTIPPQDSVKSDAPSSVVRGPQNVELPESSPALSTGADSVASSAVQEAETIPITNGDPITSDPAPTTSSLDTVMLASILERVSSLTKSSSGDMVIPPHNGVIGPAVPPSAPAAIRERRPDAEDGEIASVSPVLRPTIRARTPPKEPRSHRMQSPHRRTPPLPLSRRHSPPPATKAPLSAIPSAPRAFRHPQASSGARPYIGSSYVPRAPLADRDRERERERENRERDIRDRDRDRDRGVSDRYDRDRRGWGPPRGRGRGGSSWVPR